MPTLIPLLESEDGMAPSPMATPDAAALEALRVLMGGFAAPAPAAAFGSPRAAGDSASLQKSPAALPAVLEQLLKSDGLPPVLVPLLTNLRDKMQKGDTAQSDPVLVAEIKALLRDIVPVRPDSDHSGLPSVFAPIQTAVLSNLAQGGPSASVPLSSAALDNLAAASPPAVSGAQAPGPVIANDVLLSSAMPQALPVMERSTAFPAALPADVPALAQALLQMLSDSPESSPGSVVMPALSFESLIDEEVSTPAPAEKPADTPNLGSAILQSLGHQSTPTSSVQANDKAAATGVVERVTEVSDLITQMADRVLVTDPLHGQTQEVRIKIADNVMQDTEVRVWREDGGALRVEFDTASAYWSRILNDASPLLSQRLNERLPSGTEAQITVTVQQQGQQPEDGRSRNRQNPWELAQQAQES